MRVLNSAPQRLASLVSRAQDPAFARVACYVASFAAILVVTVTLLVSLSMFGAISIEGIIAGHRENRLLWLLDALAFTLAFWAISARHQAWPRAESAGGLHAASAEAKAAHAKGELLSRMSHDLRAPVNDIISTLDTLAGTRLQGEQLRHLESIRGAADELSSLINDVLDCANIEAGKLVLHAIEFDFRECLDNILSVMRPTAHDRGLRLEASVSPEIPSRLVGDPGRLRQVLINLIGNAIKFTEQGEVSIDAIIMRRTPHRVHLRVAVTDTGVGIAPARLPHLFHAAMPCGPDGDRPREAMGLGLLITKELVNAMGGHIGVSSNEGGSKFWFTVDVEASDRPAPGGLQGKDIRGLRALLADDNFNTRSALAQQLRALGVDTEEVSDGAAALQTVILANSSGRPFDVVIADMFLPSRNAETLGREIKSRDETRDVAFVVMTGAGQRGDGRELNQLGFAAYLQKPIPPEYVPELLRAVVATRGLTEEQRRERGLITRYTLMERKRLSPIALLADENPATRELILHVLAQFGFSCDIAATGGEALDLARAQVYDLVLVDTSMPLLEGSSLVHAMRALASPYGSSPVIALMTYASDEEKRSCLREGADRILEKQTNAPELIATIADLTGRIPSEAAARAEEMCQTTESIFLEDVAQRLRSSHAAIESNDAATVAREAYALEEASAHVGVSSMQVSAAALAALAESGELEGADVLLGRIEQAYHAFQIELLKRSAI